MNTLGQFKQNIIDETSTSELRKSKRKAGITSLRSVSANPALPPFFLMRHFTMLMRKFPGGIEAPGWGLGICWNLYTVRWRQAHRKGSTGREMKANQVDLLYCTDLNVCSVSASFSPLLPLLENKPNQYTDLWFLFIRAFVFPSIRATPLILQNNINVINMIVPMRECQPL